MPASSPREARFDGIFVLRTNADVTPLQAVLRYRELLQVERLFRQTKAVSTTLRGLPAAKWNGCRSCASLVG
jgi:hypothetical protein